MWGWRLSKLVIGSSIVAGGAAAAAVATSEDPSTSLKMCTTIPVRLFHDTLTAATIVFDYEYSLWGLEEGTVDWFKAKHEVHSRSAHRIQELCFRNGGIYIKLGQHISQLEYVVPREYVQIMRASLLKRCPVSSYDQVRKVFIKELGGAPEEIFKEFDPTPLASASIAQVHAAQTHDGRKVAVKVQHTHLTDTAVADIATVDLIVSFLHWCFPAFDYRWLVDEIRENAHKEIFSMASSSRPEKEANIGWNHGVPISQDRKKTRCNYCRKELQGGGLTRLKQHIAGIGGQVAPCNEVPREVRDEMKSHLISTRKSKVAAKLEKQRIQEELMRQPRGMNVDSDEDDEEQLEINQVLHESRRIYEDEQIHRSNRMFVVGSSGEATGHPSRLPSRSRSLHLQGEISRDNPIAGQIDSYRQKKQGRKQPGIKSALRGIVDAQKFIGRAIAKFFYFNHIAQNAADSPYYEGMFDAAQEVGRGVKPPTSWQLSNTYLEIELEETKKYLETFYSHWDEFGCTLMCDGWSTQNRKKIINFLVYSTKGTVFIKSVDATDEFQNGAYIWNLMDQMVEVIGEKRVVQVITDNGANYKSAGQLLMQKRKHLYWTPCAAHCIDLIFLDMSKEKDVKSIIEHCQALTGFIYNHGWALSLMRRETNNKELIRQAITRFATNFIALDSIYTHKDDLKRLVLSREWIERVNKCNRKDFNNAGRVKAMVLDDNFWVDVANIIVVHEPLVKVLRMVDGDDKVDMGYLYEAMDRAKEQIKEKLKSSYKRWWKMIDNRWDKQLHRDIHAAGYFLNPRFQYGPEAKNDNEVLTGFKHVIERMVPDIRKQIAIHNEAESYRTKEGSFSSNLAYKASKGSTPARWLSMVGREMAPNLTELALRIELDFLFEARNSEKCLDNFRRLSPHIANSVYAPKIYWDLSTSKLLTMEFMDAAEITDLSAIRRYGIKPVDVSKLLSQAFAEMIFKHGFVHCDPHAANLMVRPLPSSRWNIFGRRKPQLILLDHGMYRTLDLATRTNYAALWKALVFANVRAIKEYSVKLGAGEDLYALFAGILTMRPWNRVIDPSVDHLVIEGDDGDRSELQMYASQYFPQISELLRRLPRVILLLLKTNDCLRAVNHELLQGSSAEMFFIIGRVSSEVVAETKNMSDKRSLLSGLSLLVEQMLLEARLFTMRIGLWLLQLRKAFIVQNTQRLNL